MANANIPRGLIPVRHRNGAPYNGAFNIYHVPASDGTALFIGDPVVVVTNASDANGIPTVTRATAAGGNFFSGAVIGVVSAGEPMVTRTRDSAVYRLASTLAYVMVADDPDLLFEIQEDSVGGSMAVGAASRNVDLVAGTGNTNSGYSGFMADSSTLAVTATLQLRIYRPVERADNAISASDTLGKWLVYINLHTARQALGI
jgi:hypothetical protein